MFLIHRLCDAEVGGKDHAIQEWLTHGMTKICVRADSEAELLEIAQKAHDAGLTTAEVDWVNLQGGTAGRELAAAHPGMIDPLNPEVPLDEFAAAVAATDLLLTVDTMAAHCAGALGHPLWIMAPYSPHWCWSVERDRTPWYPTARLFRQTVRGDWSDAVDSLIPALTRLTITSRRRPAERIEG